MPTKTTSRKTGLRFDADHFAPCPHDDHEAAQALRDAFVVIVPVGVIVLCPVDALRLAVAVDELVRCAWMAEWAWLSGFESLALWSREWTRVSS